MEKCSFQLGNQTDTVLERHRRRHTDTAQILGSSLQHLLGWRDLRRPLGVFAGAPVMSHRPKFVKNALIPLEQISLRERSGWRSRSSSRVQQLADIFAAGQFGMGVTCGVQVLPLEDVDGASIIDDGVSTVQALVDLKKAYKDKLLEVTDPQLLAIFDQGLQVTVVTYSDNEDQLSRRAWNTGKHDEENNTVRWSSVHMKISVALDAWRTAGDWPLAIKHLSKAFNLSAATVRRWTRCAQFMDAAVLAELGKDEYENLKAYAIWENEYLMGSGVDARKKLAPEFAQKAFQVLAGKKGMYLYFLGAIKIGTNFWFW